MQGRRDKKRIDKKRTTTGEKKLGKSKTPTTEMFTIFQSYWLKTRVEKYIFKGYDGKAAQRVWRQCQEVQPDDPMGLYRERVEKIFNDHDIQAFGGIENFWSRYAKKVDRSGDKAWG